VEAFATFCALAADHGRNWRQWPSPLRRPTSPEVLAAAELRREEVDFHVWCQWQLDRQVAAAGEPGLVGDLAVGFDPGGFDAWLFQDVLADGVRVGAPGDAFNPAGQDWGFAPFVPWKLRHARYEPVLDGLTAAFAHVKAVRIDHVLGLFRLYCIPPGAEPGEGAYAAYCAPELLDLVAVAAHRAGAFVVGEDLGTVPAAVRDALAERGVLGCVVAGFEDEPPATWGTGRLATVTTHDLPTTTGLLGGYDHAQRVRLGLRGPDEPDVLAQRLAELAGVDRPTVAPEDVAAVYAAVAASPCQLVAVTTDDLCGSTEPPNMPGTIDEWPNWRIALPVPLDDLVHHPVARAVITAVEAGRAYTPPTPAPP
jgi:4-alpha-glucanotransferase